MADDVISNKERKRFIMAQTTTMVEGSRELLPHFQDVVGLVVERQLSQLDVVQFLGRGYYHAELQNEASI